MSSDSTESKFLSKFLDCFSTCSFRKSSVVGMVMPNIYSYILALGLKGPLGLDFLIIGEAIMEVYIAKITVAIHKHFDAL